MALYRSFLFFILAFCGLFSCGRNVDAEKGTMSTKQPEDTINQLLIEKYGADQYGMKPYVMAFLKRGPNRDQDSIEAERLQRAHLDNIGRLAKMGKLVVAGPFLDDTDLRGIYIFNVATIEEAKKLTESDPAIKAGRLVMELHPWYGPAGFMGLDSIQRKITKEEI